MSMTMNKLELIAAVSEEAGCSKSDAAKAVDAVFSVMAKTLKGKQEVRVAGFGSFGVSERKATTGRNPRTGEEIAIPASASVRFKPGKGLKEALNR